jgi:transposase-like protein
VLQAREQPVAAIARECLTKRKKYYPWRSRLREARPDAFDNRPSHPAAAESAEVQRSKRELARVSEERDISKAEA